MGLFSKVAEMRMKDPVEGTLRVVAMSTPDPTATSSNYRMEGVVSAEGLMPTAVTHHGMASLSRWPSAGDELQVTVDRAKPERLVVHWDNVPKGFDQAKSAAQQLAEQMRNGGATPAATPVPGMPGNVTVTVNGQPMAPGAAAAGVDLTSIIQSAVAAAEAQAPVAGDATPPTVSAADVLARGTAGHATLLGSFPAPVPVTKPGHTGVGLMLNVMVDGHPPFQVQNVYAVPEGKVGALTPGALLPIKADLNTPGLVAVDWDQVR